MSLIGDALRKTRQEAAERDGDRKGVLFSAKIADRPARSGLGLGLVLGALIAVIATVGGGLAVWWALGGGRPQEPQTSETAVSGSDREQQTANGHTVSGFDRRAGLAQPSASPAISHSSGQLQPETEAVTDSSEETDSADRGRDARATPEVASLDPDPDPDPIPDAIDSLQATAPETGYVGTENGTKVYLMEADLGDVTLSLDYIVFRPTDPYAEINGIEVHIGGTVAGFRVKSIERDRVILSDGRRTIVLRAP